ncbi:uncharacterized protein [Misgurnus anguillicaudatus]|uniref:uncharacterized protein n=1 Tax=Misgurnus anguillicaudatus TaxID=75329 RepID=UPI003CCF8C6E
MEEKLIIAVAGFPIIYDVSLFDYRDVTKKNDAWTKVSEIVGVPVDECRKRWKSLRDTYRKERKKEAERKKSGAGASSVRPWRYSGVMGFLNPFLEDRITDSNMVGGVEEALTPENREDAIARHSQAAQQCEPNLQGEIPSTNPRQSSLEGQAGQSSLTQSSEEQTGQSSRRKRPHSSREIDERMLTALETITKRSTAPQEDSDSLFF